MAQKSYTLPEVTVFTPGTPIQVTAEPIEAFSVVFQADPLNTGAVYIGDDAVNNGSGLVLNPKDTVTITAENFEIGPHLVLSDFWVDVDQPGDSVRIQYLTGRH